MGRMAGRRFAVASICMPMFVLSGVPVRAAEQAPAEGRRVALVIGNAAYKEPTARLENPVRDAMAMATVLRDLDFAVTLVTDADMVGMARAANTFIGQVRAGDVAVFYYAGHGLELEDGLNYLAPVDFSSKYDAVDAKYRSLHAGAVQERMQRAGARTRIMILDACRNNPFERSRTLTRGGLGQMGPRGGLVAFATEAGDVASDDGLYTRHLVEALREPGIQAMELFTRVSEAVEAATGGRQVPAVNFAGAAGRFVFRRGGDPVPTYAAGEVFRDCPDCPEMVVIPAGTFRMGSPASEAGREDDEGPRHEVTLRSPFALGRHEVTRAEYAAFVSATGRSSRGCYKWDGGWDLDDDASWRAPGFAQGNGHPVVCVSWEDAQAYVRWLSGETGKGYRLPSEAEWEYAARGGTTTSRYWGNGSSAQCAHANGADASAKRAFSWSSGTASCDDGVVYTASVGSYDANAFGLFDVLGNVWEWTEDCWHDTYAGAPSDGSAWTRGGDCGGRRVLRGGSWDSGPRILRSANRVGNSTGNRSENAGFRVSRTLD